MTPLFKKLNLGDHATVHVLDAPESFEPELDALDGVKIVRGARGRVSFALAFVVTQKQLDAAARKLVEAADQDAILWMVYPKGSSKRYACEFNRDSGWETLGEAGYEPVRQVSIDEDWSALRFRQAEHIRTMRRNPAGAISNPTRERGRRETGRS